MGRDKTHGDQVPFAQCLLKWNVQFTGFYIPFVQVAVNKSGVDFHHLFHQRAVRDVNAAKVAVAIAIEKAVHHLAAARVGQIDWQALAAKSALNLLQQGQQVGAWRVDLVDDDEPVQLARRGVFHHALGHGFDAHRRIDDDGSGFNRFKRGQRLTQAVGTAGGVDEMHAGGFAVVGDVHVHHAGIQRVLSATLQRVVVARCAATLQAARGGDGSGLVKQRFGQARFAGATGAHQRQRSQGGDVARCGAWHVGVSWQRGATD